MGSRLRASRKERVERIKKANKDSETTLVSFRLSSSTFEAFRKACLAEGITMTDVYKDFVEEFVNEKPYKK